MPLPFLNAPEQNIDMINQFGGYNHNLVISENQFYDMKNMSSRCFPMIATRNKRGVFTNDELLSANAIVAKDNIIFSFTSDGDIGVTLAEDVAEGVWKDPVTDEELTPEGAEDKGQTTKYTEIAACNYTGLINELLGLNPNEPSEFSRYIIVDNTMTLTTGKSPVIQDGKLVMEWEHEKIPKGTLWAKNVFTIKHWYSIPKNVVSVKTNALMKNYNYRSKLEGQNVWIDGIYPNKILKVEPSKPISVYYRDDWTVTFEKEIPESYEGKPVYVRLVEPTENDISEGKFVVTEDGSVAINPPTVIKVTADSDMHVKILKGKSLYFKDSNGYHQVTVSGYKIEDGNRYIIVDRPHSALENGAKAYGSRLYLCEYNPFTKKTVVSDIFSAGAGKHTLVEMGGYVVVFPEKVMVNTQKRSTDGRFVDIQPMEASQVINKCFMRLTDANGNGFVENGVKKCTVGNTAPNFEEMEEEQIDGWAWLDTSEKTPVLKIYSKQIEQWAKAQPYCEIRISDGTTESLSDEWQVGDAVELEFEEKGFLGEKIVPLEGQKYFVISAVKGSDGTKCIRFPASMSDAIVNTDSKLIIKRTVPDMDFVIENENRLWGCKYGEVDGEPINEIFACKLGDPKNWHCFANTAMDSYYVSLGADGAFTGAISYAGSPFFFREGCVHRIYGNYPANYNLQTIYCHGVEKGSEKGITVMNDTMFYKSPVGIMAYTGVSPICVSDWFGTEQYKNAVAGSVGNDMYFSMQDMSGNNVFFSYDDLTKTWHKEDDLRCKELFSFENSVYGLTDDNELVVMNGEVITPDRKQMATIEDDFEWSLVSGNIGYNNPFFKHIARINIRLLLERTSRASLYIQYDSDGNWHHVSNLEARGKVTNISIPVEPHRCDHFAYKIEGKGEAKILSISKFTEGGSENE